MDAYDWAASASPGRHQPSNPQSRIAWRGPSGSDEDQELVLYTKSWDNPLPGVEITSLDFVSSVGEVAPFLLAVTLDP